MKTERIDTEALEEIIREAGKIMTDAGRCGERDIDRKSGVGNFVTRYDVAVQNFLEARFSEAVPGAGFLAEEDPGDGAETGAGPEYMFVIDPIDGTQNFIRGAKQSVISVALLRASEAIWAAVLQPYTGDLYTAKKGLGARLNGIPVHVNANPLPDSLISFGTSPYYRETLGRRSMVMAANVLAECLDIRRTGSAALDLCQVASGTTDGFFEFKLSPWDYAAGSLIISEAGGIAADMEGRPLPLLSRAGSSVLAGNPANISRLLELAAQANQEN